MALKYHPSQGEVLKCNFDGFVVPEMVKCRWVVVVSPKGLNRDRLATIVPLSTTEPKSVEKFHYRLQTILPHDEGKEIVVWAKCDMVFSASFSRLSPWYLEGKIDGKRIYKPIVLPSEELAEIKKGILWSIGLGGLTKA